MGENVSFDNNSTINITYETIFELLRREKNRDELQKLSATFYEDIKNYLGEKGRILKQNHDVYHEAEMEKAQKQITNTKKMITELFERREKKIIILALNKVRTSSAITDTASMLNDEKEFFSNLVETFSKYRSFILNKMFLENSASNSKKFEFAAGMESNSDISKSQSPEKKSEEQTMSATKPTKTLKILSSIPKFMGKHFEVYGPFNPDDMASLPTEIADILIKKGRAEEIKS